MSIRNGEQYIRSIHDQRKVIYKGEEVDVIKHMGFSETTQAVAQFYDFQSSREMRETMTYQTADGKVAGMAFRSPKSAEDFADIAKAYSAWAEVTCGMMGRSPDYMNTSIACLAGIARPLAALEGKCDKDIQLVLAKFQKTYDAIRDGDLCLTHTFVDPFKIVAESESRHKPGLRIAKTSNDGIFVSGKRGIATLAPFANLNLNIGVLNTGASSEHAAPFAFVVPIACEGLYWTCRDTMATLPNGFYSTSQSADEMDCVAIFEECFIPNEQLFALLPIDSISNAERLVDGAFARLRYHTIIRFVAKTKFMIGLAHLLAQSSKVSRFINVRERLGEMVNMLHTMEAFAAAAISKGGFDVKSGEFKLDSELTKAAIRWIGVFYDKMIDTMLKIGGSRFISTPQYETFERLGEKLEEYFAGSGQSGRQNVALHRLAWDVVGSQFGMRQRLYENFHFGDRALGLMQDYESYSKDAVIAMVKRMLLHTPRGRKRFPSGIPG